MGASSSFLSIDLTICLLENEITLLAPYRTRLRNYTLLSSQLHSLIITMNLSSPWKSPHRLSSTPTLLRRPSTTMSPSCLGTFSTTPLRTSSTSPHVSLSPSYDEIVSVFKQVWHVEDDENDHENNEIDENNENVEPEPREDDPTNTTHPSHCSRSPRKYDHDDDLGDQDSTPLRNQWFSDILQVIGTENTASPDENHSHRHRPLLSTTNPRKRTDIGRTPVFTQSSVKEKMELEKPLQCRACKESEEELLDGNHPGFYNPARQNLYDDLYLDRREVELLKTFSPTSLFQEDLRSGVPSSREKSETASYRTPSRPRTSLGSSSDMQNRPRTPLFCLPLIATPEEIKSCMRLEIDNHAIRLALFRGERFWLEKVYTGGEEL